MSTPAQLTPEQTEKHRQILAKREYIDRQMKEIDGTPDSYYRMQQIDYETAMLAGVLWAMLATGTIYYVFTKV